MTRNIPTNDFVAFREVPGLWMEHSMIHVCSMREYDGFIGNPIDPVMSDSPVIRYRLMVHAREDTIEPAISTLDMLVGFGKGFRIRAGL